MSYKINLLYPEHKKPRWKKTKIFFLFFLIVLSIVSATAFSYQIFSKENTQNIAENIDNAAVKPPLLTSLRELILDPVFKKDRTNILLLGTGGVFHEGPNLTDTIVLASVSEKNKKVALVSIPRDLVLNMPPYGERKINSANALAEADERGSGGEYTAKIINKTFDLPVHYYVRIDFDGLAKIIDELGGLNIYVDKTFLDPLFPVETPAGQNENRATTVSFEQGWQIMDGKTVLKYVRSRHGNNGENSDFSRAKRQQKVLIALADQMFATSTLLNPQKAITLVQNLDQHIKTNFKLWEIVKWLKLAYNLKYFEIIQKYLDDSPASPLYAAIRDGVYMLLPKNDDLDGLRDLVQNIFEENEADKIISTGQISAPEKIFLEVLNGTTENGKAQKTANFLKRYGFNASYIGNAPRNDFEKTVVYKLSQNIDSELLIRLKNLLEANISSEQPLWLKPQSLQSNIVIILGKN